MEIILKLLCKKPWYLFLMAIGLSITVKSASAQSANITLDCAIDKGTLFRAEGYNNVSGVNTGAATRDADYSFMSSQGIRAKVLRVWVSESLYNRNTDTYNFGSYDDYLSDVSNYFADSILVAISGHTMVESWKYTPDQCKPILKNIIRYLKTNYPKVKYIEGLNEPDLYGGTEMTVNKVYSYYKAFYQAVNEVNAELNPAVPLLVGGPAISSIKYNANWLRQFLDDYVADSSPDKKLDFLSFHTYSYKSSPKEVNDLNATVKAMYTSRGLPADMLTMVTETGLFPGDATSGSFAEDALVQAAGMASYTYWYTNTKSNLVPFNWVLRHAAEGRKDQMVTRPNSYSDKLTPYGNMLKMMAMMKTERISANSNALDEDGFGVYGLAASDATGISVMVWNYQHTQKIDYYATVTTNNLPAIFNGKGVRMKVYKIDQTTSNNYYSLSNCNLQLVADSTVSNPGSSFALPLGILTENSLQLVLLEPADLPMADPFSVGAKHTETGTILNWNTQNETGSDYFEILRSTDGNSFTNIGSVTAAGNSASALNYSYTDDNPEPGINYYKVLLKNIDNSTQSSNTVSVFNNVGVLNADIYYDFGASPTFSAAATSGVPTGWTVSSLSVNGNGSSNTNFFTETSPSNSYSGSSANGNATVAAKQGSLNGRTVTYNSVTTNIPATGISSLSYFEVTLLPNATESVKLNGIKFGSRSIGTSGGPANVVIRTSVDNFASDVFNQNINSSSAWTLVNANFSSAVSGAIGAPVTLRIYANDAVGSTSSNNWRIDDLDINVDYSPSVPSLNSFEANVSNNTDVQLLWKTSSEQNSSIFEIQRSTDGNDFSTIGTVPAAGNSNTVLAYQYLDGSASPGINYYRIKENSTGGDIFSDVVGVYIATGASNNIYYSFGATGDENGHPTSGVPVGFAASDVSIGNSVKTSDFFTSTSSTGNYAGNSKEGNATLIAKTGSLQGRTVTYNSVTTTLAPSGIASLSYFEVSIVPPATEHVKIDKISFGSRSIGTSGGPARVVIRSNLDNYTSDIYAQNINANSSWALIDAVLATPILATDGQTVTLRIYADDAVGGSANSWRIDDLNISLVNDPTVLPVALTVFTAKSTSAGVKLTWQTESEYNNSHFEILRSADGEKFEEIAKVSGSNANVTARYDYLDQSPLREISYYQLKQVDNNGNFKIYGPIAVKNGFISDDFKIYIADDLLHIYFYTAKATLNELAVFDLSGHKVYDKKVGFNAGANNLSFPLSLKAGVYIARISGNGLSAVKKMIR